MAKSRYDTNRMGILNTYKLYPSSDEALSLSWNMERIMNPRRRSGPVRGKSNPKRELTLGKDGAGRKRSVLASVPVGKSIYMECDGDVYPTNYKTYHKHMHYYNNNFICFFVCVKHYSDCKRYIKGFEFARLI